jgi:prepilin signal peptidase PulO-like enzyme (type II secretory pathway)
LLKIFDPVVVAAIATGGGVGAIIDMRTRRVPNVLTGTIAALGLLLAILHVTPVSPVSALGPGCDASAHLIGAPENVKLMAARTLLGPAGVLMASFIRRLRWVLALPSLGRGRLRDTIDRTAIFVHTRGANVEDIESTASNNRFAYAPAIAIGALVAAFGL